jgi:hypothetical protein
MLIANLPVLESIIQGEPEVVRVAVLRDGVEVEETRVIVIHPRDQIAAMRLVHAIAPEGVLPRGYRESVHQEEPKDDPERRLPLPPNLPSTFQAFARPESIWPVSFGEDQDGEDGEEPSTEGWVH